MAPGKPTILALCLMALFIPATYAQDARNGALSETSESSPNPRAGDLSVAVPIGGPWIEFGFTRTGSFAVGCTPEDPAGLGCGASSGGNSIFGGAPPWTFTAPEGGATLIVTDAFLLGDQFEIFDFGASIGATSVSPVGGDCASDPDPCVADPFVSHGLFFLDPGPHQITIQMLASPFDGGAAYFRIEPSAMDFYSLVPCRVVDTRGAVGPLGGPILTSGQVRSFPVAGACGIPADAQAVAFNVTVVGPTGLGYLQVVPAGISGTSTSSLSFAGGQIRTNNGIVALTGRRLSVRPIVSGSPGTVHIVIDISGYFR